MLLVNLIMCKLHGNLKYVLTTMLNSFTLHFASLRTEREKITTVKKWSMMQWSKNMNSLQ